MKNMQLFISHMIMDNDNDDDDFVAQEALVPRPIRG